ncbi:hypothetical protein LCGC14_2568830, partial [marine sediment metagenome]
VDKTCIKDEITQVLVMIIIVVPLNSTDLPVLFTYLTLLIRFA